VDKEIKDRTCQMKIRPLNDTETLLATLSLIMDILEQACHDR
jgi:hypothetical protein